MSGLNKSNPGSDYAQLFAEVKERVRSAQYAALKAVNTELVGLYWDIGRMIAERQKKAGWGRSVVETLSLDLRHEFPGVAGFSVQNLWYMRQFYLEYSGHEKLQPLVGEIAWAHNLVVMSKCKDPLEREFYIRMTRKFGWTALDREVRQEDENPSIGIIFCKDKNRTVVEYALHDAGKPIGVATCEITRTLPKELRGHLPKPEDIAALLEGIEE